MVDDENDLYGKLSDDGNDIKVHYKTPQPTDGTRGTNRKNPPMKDEDVPLNFTDYCVSKCTLIFACTNLPGNFNTTRYTFIE